VTFFRPQTLRGHLCMGYLPPVSRITRVALMALALSICGAPASWPQAQSVQVPAKQRALSDILSKYNDLHYDAPNDIQRDKIDADSERNSAPPYQPAMFLDGSARLIRLTTIHPIKV